MRTDARARPLKTAPRKSGEFHQAESLLQDTREKLANDLLPGGSTEVQQNKQLLRNWHEVKSTLQTPSVEWYSWE